jgi:nucleoside-diphosphate-sugar epimerase
MKIAITGSSGFVGNFLAKHFSAQGITVFGFDRNQLNFQKEYQNFTFIQSDIRDHEKIKKVFAAENFTHVIHLAFLMAPQHDKNFEHDVDVNGSKNIFDIARETPSVQQFINFSSASIYGGWPDNPAWIDENYPIRPREWYYAINKKEVEEYYFSAPKNFKLVNFRMCTACGDSYFRNDGLVNIIAKSPLGLLINGQPLQVQFIHETDVINLVELVINDSEIEGIYNLAPDSFAAEKDLSPNFKIYLPMPKFIFKSIIGLLWNLRLIPVSPTSVDLTAHSIILSPKKLMSRCNYKFKYTVKEAFLDDWYKGDKTKYEYQNK